MAQEEKRVILTVDDTAAILATIRAILRNNYDVRVCKDALMAQYMVDHIPIDMVLLDIDMPGISGFELLDYIRSKPERKNIPVIFVTGFANKEIITKAVNAGALDYIIKPIQPGILINKIANIFDSRKKEVKKDGPRNINTEGQKPILSKNATQAEITDYFSYMFKALNTACLLGNCEVVEQLVKELGIGNFEDIINKKVDELAALMVSFDYQPMLKIISSAFNVLGKFEL